MSVVEGLGLVEPTPVTVAIPLCERERLRVTAQDIAKYRGYGRSSDEWSRGFFARPEDSIYFGLVGEFAFAQWLKKVLGMEFHEDCTLKPQGDGGTDFVVRGTRVQVKTGSGTYRSLLVRTKKLGLSIEEIPEVFVRAQYPVPAVVRPTLFGNSEPLDCSVCELRGFCYENELTSRVPVPARRGKHMNYEVQPNEFRSMNDLAALLRARTTYKGVRCG